MKCPRDGEDLQEVEIRGVAVYRCPLCGGLLLELRGDPRLSLDQEKLRQAAWESLQDSDLVSPLSGKPMRVFHYEGVELDYCEATSAIWLDRGEWEKLAGRSSQIDAVSRSWARSESNVIANGIDATHTGFEIVDLIIEFVGEAASSLFDGF
ncbi:MAG: zf-TFIIB domain-containing protein [Verrucomicrobiota bacterium]